MFAGLWSPFQVRAADIAEATCLGRSPRKGRVVSTDLSGTPELRLDAPGTAAAGLQQHRNIPGKHASGVTNGVVPLVRGRRPPREPCPPPPTPHAAPMPRPSSVLSGTQNKKDVPIKEALWIRANAALDRPLTKLAMNTDLATNAPPILVTMPEEPAEQSEQTAHAINLAAVDTAGAASAASAAARSTSVAAIGNLSIDNLPGMPESMMQSENRSCMVGSGLASARRADVPSPVLAQSTSDLLVVGTNESYPQLPQAGCGPRVKDDAIWEAMEKAAQFSSHGLFWEVIAGVYNGGIAVNDTADPTSPEIGKLAHGALVMQVGSHSGRMRYELLEGSGPSTGWVCLEKDGQELLATAGWAARLNCVSLVPGRARTLFVFDWDDTLLPLAWLESRPGLKLNKPPKVRSGTWWEQLADHARVVESMLATARALGEVVVVTLSQRPWVESSAQDFMPSVFHQIKQTRVLYGREFAHASMSADDNYWITLKHSAMQKALEAMNGSSEAPWMNLVSIGDSYIEKRAAMSLGYTCSKNGSVKWTKTIKLNDRPEVTELTEQLRTLQGSLADVVERRCDCHLFTADLRC
mmetsp:Transcript_100524/g.194095  ORF Transcript_100524/g.194095 Transcript_100524/m.194095 type:complete len:581 (-) Transcript_100524:255-1997(-)